MIIRMRKGQAAAEYIITFAALVIVVSMLLSLVYVSDRYARRTESLVTSDCP